MNETRERLDTGHVTYGLQQTGPNPMGECHNDYADGCPCTLHYVVRLDGTWIRGFHNETDAQRFVEDLREIINR